MSYEHREESLRISLLLPRVAIALLKSVETESKQDKKISDENLLALHSVFGNVLERALEIILRKDSVTVYALQNDHRSLIEVKGNNDKVYRLLPNVNYCFCQAFRNYVLQTKSEITCKHILAAYVAKVTQTINECSITKEQFNLLYESFLASDDFDTL